MTRWPRNYSTPREKKVLAFTATSNRQKRIEFPKDLHLIYLVSNAIEKPWLKRRRWHRLETRKRGQLNAAGATPSSSFN
jgi:hypothetical protein